MSKKRQQPISLEDYYLSNEKEEFTPRRKSKKEGQLELKSKPKRVKSSEKAQDLKIREVGSALSASAKETLKFHLERLPINRELSDKIAVLSELLVKYKQLGETNLYNETKQMIATFKASQKKFLVETYRRNFASKTERDELSEKLSTDETIKELNTKIRLLNSKIKLNNPNSLVTLFSDLRKSLISLGDFNYDDEPLNLDDEPLNLDDEPLNLDDEPLNLDDEISDEISDDELLDSLTNKISISTSDRFNNICVYISQIIDVPVDELANMKNNEILKLLKANQINLEPFKQELRMAKISLSERRSELTGVEEITKLLVNTFDFSTVNENEVKQMLAAANIDIVKSLAYNICVKSGMERYLDDAIGYGLLALSKVINTWFNIQKDLSSDPSPRVNPFKPMIYSNVGNVIKRGLYEISGGGMASGSILATHANFLKKRVDELISSHEEYKFIPREILEGMVDSSDLFSARSVMGETDYTSMIGGDDDSNAADIWDSANSSNSADTNHMELKMEYESLMKGFQIIFDLSETKNGESKDKKMFDNIDFIIMQYMFGFETDEKHIKMPKTLNKRAKKLYSQDEIVNILNEKLKNGELISRRGTGTMSQSAISTRIKNIMTKLRNIGETHPEVIKSLKFISENLLMNNDTLKTFSNESIDNDFKFNRTQRSLSSEIDFDEINRKLREE